MAERVGRLTAKGIGLFRAYLEEVRGGSTEAPPYGLLTDREASERFLPECPVEPRHFDNRLDAARYLSQVFGDVRALEEDVGVWSWLSLFYFDQVCPVGPDGVRSPGRDYRHILDPGYRNGHRHLLAGPFLVYKLHGDEAVLLLCTRLNHENMFHHELASRQAFISNSAILRSVNLLYLDTRTGRPKRGAQDSHESPGTLRRFVDVVQQLDLNYDLYSMSPEAILGLLPSEFDKWKRKWPFGWRKTATNAAQ
ncbi:MAG TPA: hypothetical protein VNO43_10565 [Candidatus Eisenbacteria bacterium]|nr:hypothetical protein [Candidatus Eisenbacteria bacterium]